jgi:hypothetical protein
MNAEFSHYVGASIRAAPYQTSVSATPTLSEFSRSVSLHTAIIDRQGRLVTSIEGNQFTADQLGDSVQTVLTRGKGQHVSQTRRPTIKEWDFLPPDSSGPRRMRGVCSPWNQTSRWS